MFPVDNDVEPLSFVIDSLRAKCPGNLNSTPSFSESVCGGASPVPGCKAEFDKELESVHGSWANDSVKNFVCEKDALSMLLARIPVKTVPTVTLSPCAIAREY